MQSVLNLLMPTKTNYMGKTKLNNNRLLQIVLLDQGERTHIIMNMPTLSIFAFETKARN